MKKLAYLQCPTGISGDMCLGALVDAGVPLDYLQAELAKLGISAEYHLRSAKVLRNGQQATKVFVDLQGEEHSQDHSHHDHPHHDHAHHSHGATRHLPDIEQFIQKAQLPPQVEKWSLAIFRNLAVAEGAVHGISPEKVHFHEVGATDAIVDIVGTCLGLDWLGIHALYCSALPTGGGTVKAAHGRLAVPVPAVLKLWEQKQVPVYSNGIERELVTPTGAAIAITLAQGFGPPPPMTLQRVGLGAGSQNLAIPNILRLWIGESPAEDALSHAHSHPEPSEFPLEPISVLETQIDDLNPQAIGYVLNQLLEVGAVDVFTQPIGMKKSRPGTLLTVICPPEKLEICQKILFQETTTLGIRRRTQQRAILNREFHPVTTPYGTVQIKVAWQEIAGQKQIFNVQPEYEDCAKIAQTTQQPWREIHRLALAAWHEIGLY